VLLFSAGRTGRKYFLDRCDRRRNDRTLGYPLAVIWCWWSCTRVSGGMQGPTFFPGDRGRWERAAFSLRVGDVRYLMRMHERCAIGLRRWVARGGKTAGVR